MAGVDVAAEESAPGGSAVRPPPPESSLPSRICLTITPRCGRRLQSRTSTGNLWILPTTSARSRNGELGVRCCESQGRTLPARAASARSLRCGVRQGRRRVHDDRRPRERVLPRAYDAATCDREAELTIRAYESVARATHLSHWNPYQVLGRWPISTISSFGITAPRLRGRLRVAVGDRTGGGGCVADRHYLKVVDGRAPLPVGRSEFRTFLFGVIRRTASDERRRRAIRASLSLGILRGDAEPSIPPPAVASISSFPRSNRSDCVRHARS